MPERKPARGTETTAHVFPTSIPDFEMGMVPPAGIQRAVADGVGEELHRSAIAAAAQSFARCGAAQPAVAICPCQTWSIRSDLPRTGGQNPSVDVNE